MRTRRFSFFCLSGELAHALTSCLGEGRDVMMFAEEGEALRLASLDEIGLVKQTVLWATADGTQPTSFLGLVQIVPPRCKDNLLCMASIAIKADTSNPNCEMNLRMFNELRKLIGKHFKWGVWGVNVKHGGEHLYKDIGISDGAIAQFRAGRELAPEGGDGFVRFEYRTGDSGSA
jgi:hypothetical protein